MKLLIRCLTALLVITLTILFAMPDMPPDAHVVVFYRNDGTAAFHRAALSVSEGEFVSQPSPPRREGYIFRYWTTDAPGQNRHDFSLPITASQSLWAQWEEETLAFHVQFHFNDGTDIRHAGPKLILEGEQALEPVPPVREGYRFLHWATDPIGAHPFDFETPVTGYLDLYAKWLAFPPPIDALDDLLSRHGNRVAVYFENLETGFTYLHNADRIFSGASVLKAPFSMYIYQKADRGETDLETRIRFPRGGSRTQSEMLRRNLMYSCNESTLGLRNVHGWIGFRQFVADLGGNPDWVWSSIMGARLSANEAGLFAGAIYDYIESDAPHSEMFKTHLLDNQFPFIVSDYPVASKSGWTGAVLHDMAIVYAPSPYILVILSSRISTRDFEEISMAFQAYNDTWFGDLG